mgnify:CR=1 FL=1
MLGIDIVYLPEFKKRFKNISLDKVFLSIELSQNPKPENLAGIFAAKEAFFKAIGKKENWLEVWIEKDKFGKPSLSSSLLKTDQKAQISISHARDYATATVFIER